MGKITNIIVIFFTLTIKAYQYLLSPLLGQRCRFYPSCSSYAMTAFQTVGLWYACYLTFHRLLRCHPWCEGGFDPVPEKKTKC